MWSPIQQNTEINTLIWCVASFLCSELPVLEIGFGPPSADFRSLKPLLYRYPTILWQCSGKQYYCFKEELCFFQGWLKVHYNVWNHTFKYEKKWPLGMHLWDSKRAGIHIRDFLSLWMMYFFMTIPWRKVLKIGYKHLLKTRLDHWSTVIIVLLRCVHPADPGNKVMIK